MVIAAPTVGTPIESGNTTSTAVPWPTVVNPNDFSLLFGSVNNTGLVTLPSGWTSIGSFSSGSGGGTTGGGVGSAVPDIFLAYKFAVGTEDSTNQTVAHNNNASLFQILCFGGVDQTTPLDAPKQVADPGGGSGVVTIPALTVATAGATLVACAALSGSASTSTPPGTWTETCDRTGANTRCATMAYKQNVSTGTTGTVAFTFSGAGNRLGILIALRPAGASLPNWAQKQSGVLVPMTALYK